MSLDDDDVRQDDEADSDIWEGEEEINAPPSKIKCVHVSSFARKCTIGISLVWERHSFNRMQAHRFCYRFRALSSDGSSKPKAKKKYGAGKKKVCWHPDSLPHL